MTLRDIRPGHPVHTFMVENRQAEALLAKIGQIFDGQVMGNDLGRIEVLARDQLCQIDRHYLRQENQLFPLLAGLGGKTETLRADHDEVRASLRKMLQDLREKNLAAARDRFRELRHRVEAIIHREEREIFPPALQTLGPDDWARLRREEEEIGFAWVTPGTDWRPVTIGPDELKLDTGTLPAELVNLVLTALPVDLTFVDERDRVRYYTGTRQLFFPRGPAVIGRRLQECPPPAGLRAVERILEEFKAGRREAAELWMRLEDRFVYLRYIPVRDRQGRYRGTLEVGQDVTRIRELQGERREADLES